MTEISQGQDRARTAAGPWPQRRAEPGIQVPINSRLKIAGQGVAMSVLQTGEAARTERFDGPPGSAACFFAEAGATTGTGSPIVVEGRLWGAAVVASRYADAFPVGTERRIADFTELIATAVATLRRRLS